MSQKHTSYEILSQNVFTAPVLSTSNILPVQLMTRVPNKANTTTTKPFIPKQVGVGSTKQTQESKMPCRTTDFVIWRQHRIFRNWIIKRHTVHLTFNMR